MTRSYARALPVEQWQQILEKSSPGDLCNVMLTSSYMKSLASKPELWGGMKVSMRKVQENGLKELYSINRFKKIKKIDFEGITLTSEEMERLWNDIQGTPLKSVGFRWVNLNEVPAELLASVVVDLEEVDLSCTDLHREHCNAIFRLAAVDCNLKKLNMGGNDLSSLDPYTGEQKIEAYIRKLQLGYNDLQYIPKEIRVVTQLEQIDLSCTKLSNGQCEDIFRLAAADDCKLRKLKMDATDLSTVHPETLARAVAKLEEVSLARSQLTEQQCEAIVRLAAASASTLKKLFRNGNNFSTSGPEFLDRVQVYPKNIMIRVVGQDSNELPEINFRAKQRTQIKKLKKSYADRVQIPITSLVFLFNGKRLDDDDTPKALEMDQGVVIEAYQE